MGNVRWDTVKIKTNLAAVDARFASVKEAFDAALALTEEAAKIEGLPDYMKGGLSMLKDTCKNEPNRLHQQVENLLARIPGYAKSPPKDALMPKPEAAESDPSEAEREAWRMDPKQSYARITYSVTGNGLYRWALKVEVRPYPNPVGWGGMYGGETVSTKAEFDAMLESLKVETPAPDVSATEKMAHSYYRRYLAHGGPALEVFEASAAPVEVKTPRKPAAEAPRKAKEAAPAPAPVSFTPPADQDQRKQLLDRRAELWSQLRNPKLKDADKSKLNQEFAAVSAAIAKAPAPAAVPPPPAATAPEVTEVKATGERTPLAATTIGHGIAVQIPENITSGGEIAVDTGSELAFTKPIACPECKKEIKNLEAVGGQALACPECYAIILNVDEWDANYDPKSYVVLNPCTLDMCGDEVCSDCSRDHRDPCACCVDGDCSECAAPAEIRTCTCKQCETKKAAETPTEAFAEA